MNFEAISIGPADLPRKARELRAEGYRLVQIGAARIADQLELTYSFDRDLQALNLRLSVPAAGARLESISSVYWCAFLYENELHDLFNIQVDGLVVDFHGHLYHTAVKFPFGSTRPPSASAITTTPAPPGSARTVPAIPVPGSTAGARPPGQLN